MHKIRRIVVYIMRFMLIFMILYGIAVPFGALVPVRNREDFTVDSEDSFIYLIDNGFHVEICLPAAYAHERVRDILDVEEEPLLYCFGWGDRDFYPGTPMINDLELLPTLKALFIPSTGAIGITCYERPLIEGGQVRKIPVTKEQLDRLYTFIASYLIDEEIASEEISSNYGDIRFFEAGGTYSLLFTCNNWTNQALKQAGIDTHLWTPTTWGVGP